ncbi:MAG: Unknown protein [uncultured Campylobacterales bacterium]|uniref:DUF1640 domain-containing protein n=1 Tax=uncultured Campylobacterales bacterium TaxID=352960 RepID=A0A6S6T1Y3_9BACT|nr:MAG: Unknown protein [uncultured Campylobacterales bacterium]
MDKTKVDDMLISMIEPKIDEIERKFSNNEALDNQDINTLLLKSQYNHINHLDLKLNEVTADVASLKGEFNGLRGEFNGLKGEFNGLRGEFSLLESRMETMIQKALNKNMMSLIIVLGLFMTISKIIDTFL